MTGNIVSPVSNSAGKTSSRNCDAIGISCVIACCTNGKASCSLSATFLMIGINAPPSCVMIAENARLVWSSESVRPTPLSISSSDITSPSSCAFCFISSIDPL